MKRKIGLIIKKFNRIDYGDKCKDELEVVLPNGKVDRCFVWYKRKKDLNDMNSFYRLRDQLIAKHEFIEYEETRCDDWLCAKSVLQHF